MKIPKRIVAAEATTGRRLVDVPFTGGSWEKTLNEVGSLTVDVPLYDRDVRALALDLTAAPAHSLLGCLYDDYFVQGGPVWDHAYDKDKQVLKVSASNSRSYFARRPILPPGDKDIPPLLANGAPNPDLNTVVSGLDLGSVARHITKQASDNQGLPMAFEAARAGSESREYLGADFKGVEDALSDINSVINGPDIAFDMRWTADRLGVEILMRTGTAAQPRLFGKSVVRWDYASRQRGIRNLQVQNNGSEMASVVWTTGGRVRDVLLIDRRDDAGAMYKRGYPRMDMVDSTHSSVEDPTLLGGYGQENLRNSSDVTSFWEFEVRIDLSPFFGTYDVGDYCIINIKNDPYIPDGQYLRRIVSMSGDLGSSWVKVTVGNVIGGGPNG